MIYYRLTTKYFSKSQFVALRNTVRIWERTLGLRLRTTRIIHPWSIIDHRSPWRKSDSLMTKLHNGDFRETWHKLSHWQSRRAQLLRCGGAAGMRFAVAVVVWCSWRYWGCCGCPWCCSQWRLGIIAARIDPIGVGEVLDGCSHTYTSVIRVKSRKKRERKF